MLAYWFRFLDGNGKPNRDAGMVVAEDEEMLFDLIEEKGDPQQVELKQVVCGSFMVRLSPDDAPDDACFYEEDSVEFSDDFPDWEEDGWFRPNWPDEILFDPNCGLCGGHGLSEEDIN